MQSLLRRVHLLSVVLLMTLIVGTILPVKSAYALCNAVQKKDVTTWGVKGVASATTPNLNGGAFSYHRVGVAQWSPWRFVEFGWIKEPTNNFRGLISYDNGAGVQNQSISLSAGNYFYSMQYDPNTGKYWFYVNGTNIWNVNANFSAGNIVIAGGEVGNCVESMGNTVMSNLQWVNQSPPGTFTYNNWNGYNTYLDDAPYYNQYISQNSFYNKGP